MTRYVLLVLVAVFMVAGNVRAEGEVAFVDWQEVFKRFYKTELAQAQIRQQRDDIERERNEFKAEVEALNEEIEGLRTDARDDTLSVEVRANTRNLLEEKLVELQQKERDMAEFEKLRMEQLEQQNARMTRKLFDEIREAAINYAKSKNYAAVIDSSAQSRVGTEAVLYVKPEFDITADVLLVLNEGHMTESEDASEGGE